MSRVPHSCLRQTSDQHIYVPVQPFHTFRLYSAPLARSVINIMHLSLSLYISTSVTTLLYHMITHTVTLMTFSYRRRSTKNICSVVYIDFVYYLCNITGKHSQLSSSICLLPLQHYGKTLAAVVINLCITVVTLPENTHSCRHRSVYYRCNITGKHSQLSSSIHTIQGQWLCNQAN